VRAALTALVPLAQRCQPSHWNATITPAQRSVAIAAALDVGIRITDPDRVRSGVRSASSQTSYPRTARWTTHDVAQGDAGLALLCAHLDACFPDESWDVRAHDLLTSAACAAERAELPPGLFSGLSGIGLVTQRLSRDGTRYQRLTQSIDEALLLRTLALAQSARERSPGLAVGHFDVISGLAGIGAFLLSGRDRDGVGPCLERVLGTLVDVVSARGGTVPAWFTPRELLGDANLAARYPHGVLNCGMAHGIPGVVALMALALAQGVDIPGLRDATATAAGWLAGHQCDDEWGVNWPVMVGLPEGSAERAGPSRAAWCYGSPGVARALWLAGCALGDDALAALAVTAMEAVYRRPLPARNIDSPTFCHGVAGLLQITLRFAHDTGLPVFTQAAGDLAGQLLGAYNPDSLLGFCSVEPGGTRVDQPGLLDGAPGVALVLLAAATDVPPAWDRLFLLA
jgi:hypothetical protein